MLNGAKRSEASPEGYRNLGKNRSCQHSGILQDCFHRAGALESLKREARQNCVILKREALKNLMENTGKAAEEAFADILETFRRFFSASRFRMTPVLPRFV